MSKSAEMSPLYSREFSPRDRRAIQLANNRVVSAGMSSYRLQSDRHVVFLEGLNLNGLKSNEATLGILFNPTHTLLTYIDHPDANNALCRLDMRASVDSARDWQDEEIPYWRIEARIIETKQGYEGNGLAKALFVATETLVPAWLHYLGEPQRVLAYHIDGARGAEESTEQKTGYRTNWTSNLLHNLGYSNSRNTLEYYLGDRRVKEMGTPDKHWIKVLRQ